MPKKPRRRSPLVPQDTKRGWERVAVLEAREWAASREAVLARGDPWITWSYKWTLTVED